MTSFLIYILQVSVCQSVFYILYYFVFSKQTFFQVNRFYLLTTTLFSFAIPLISIGVWNAGSIENSFSNPLLFIFGNQPTSETQSVLSKNYHESFGESFLILGIFLGYIAGIIFYFTKLILGLWKVISIIQQNKAVDNGSYKLICLKSGPAFFSFLNYIFINDKNISLSGKDFSHVLKHEEIHVQQGHTYDILFMEFISITCWFNPLMQIMKNDFRQIHEFIADQQVVSNMNNSEQYSRLILRLSANDHAIPFAHQFSKINIKNRITMLNNTKCNAMKTLNYLLTLPMILVLMSFFSFTEISKIPNDGKGNLHEEKLIIGDIIWKGNIKYNDSFLTKYLGVKKGSSYNKQEIENKIIFNPMSVGITDLYMDTGYLFFSIDTKEEIIGNTINLTFEIFEGSEIKIDKIIITGNSKVQNSKVLELIDFKKGDLFNRSKLIQSQRNIAKSGFFKPDEVGINPIPHPGSNLVDIEFVLVELE